MSLLRPHPAALLAALLFTTAASAQLKLPGSAPSRAGSPTLSAPAPAPAPAPVPSPAPSPTATPAAAEAASAGKDVQAMEQAGQQAAAGWLLLLDRRDWGTAWDTAATGFRSSVPLANWMDGIPKVRAPLGALIDRKPLQAIHKNQLQGRPDGDYVTVFFASRFDKKADAQETVTTVRDADGKWRVMGYSVR
ncbi:DUF4019 domain-containing protein [Ramlibacter sp. AW1]|uniref:DUF4019 domain-containing protein n=1 Tax=Ramlibacter aurantiacus TaxID=2801330 RepID=A0A936ZNM0_9BURK|nr:DUF4019 domain-containing protein [Ramlibacter aurantiacus]MBL0419546.1 DUF4019 domain-containing protein [Ramlibacter aurantiacus]